MEHMAAGDALVYAVDENFPRLRFTPALAGRKSLFCEELSAGVCVETLADTGTTHFFASADYLRNNGISFKPVSVPSARLANGTQVRTLGTTSALELKLDAFRIKHEFHVVDMDRHAYVLGTSFLHQVILIRLACTYYVCQAQRCLSHSTCYACGTVACS
jgi:hypothetical protein